MNPPNGQAPLDYLNQIAPQTPKRPLFELNFRTIVFGAIILVVLVIIISIISSSISNAQKQPWQHLSARLETTAAIVDDAGPKLKSSQLRSANSDLKLYFTNTQRDLAPYLTRLGIAPKKLPGSVVTAESATAILADLENGRLNAKYDTTYSREMGYRLATLIALQQQLINSHSGTTKVFLQKAHDNLYPTYKAIESFDRTSE